MSLPNKERPFKVIISGGGVAGLTLANCLQHANINFVLLESRDTFAPQLGASIGFGPDGCRILDQLGCFDEIANLTEPIIFAGSHSGETGEYVRAKADAFQLITARSNYGMYFLDRQYALEALKNKIADKSKIFVNKKVKSAVQDEKGVTVECEDGTLYSGDIVVGADGVFSKVRREMWRAADKVVPGVFTTEEKNRITAEYKCVYGISNEVYGVTQRGFENTYKKNISPLVATGRDGRVYWFLIAKMDRVYKTGEIPRFTKEEAKALVEENLDITLMPGATVKVRDLWEKQMIYNMVPLEEGYHTKWSWGRYCCIGDSVHKMTPNTGSGGNAAIESAAALANELHKALKTSAGKNLTYDEIRTALTGYQSVREKRAEAAVNASGAVTRVHAMKTFMHKIVSHYIMAKAGGDILADIASDMWIGSIRIDYLPIPERSIGGTMPFNPDQGMGKNENMLMRALYAVPLILPILFRNSLPLDLLGDSGSELQQVINFGTIYSILLMEGARRASVMTPQAVPVAFAIASHFWGIQKVIPCYYFLYYAVTPMSRFRAGDLRLTNLIYSRSVLPLILGAYYLPFITSKMSGASTWIGNGAMTTFHIAPLVISVGQWLCSKWVFPSTMAQDRLVNVTRDLKMLKTSVSVTAAISSFGSMYEVIATMTASLNQSSSLKECCSYFLRGIAKREGTWLNIASLLWTGYLFSDLRRAGMVRVGWPVIIPCLAASGVILGPVGTLAWFWVWREDMLANKRHKSAIVSTAHVSN